MNQKTEDMSSANQDDAPTGEGGRSEAKVSRVVHTSEGVVRSSFEMHPSHARLARSLEHTETERAAPQACAATTGGISRESVLKAMVAHAQGLTARDISVAILGRNDERAVHRISAHLAREVQRGLVVADKGRGVKRRLTDKGREVAAQMELHSAQNKQRREEGARAAAEAAARARINGVFGYAQKIALGILG